MSCCTLCPHLVQEYFERVSDILTTYRPQILKQVDYEKVSENLVLRGTLRPEEHQKILYQCEDVESQVSQMLVVIQNRMWGLENLIAVFMEEHINPWLSQELFRAYSDHLVNPLKQQRENRVCGCVRVSNSTLYKGWIHVLKSVDTWILKAGNVLGFINQTIYPTTDNMLAFLSEKLADYSGGDSQSARDDLVPFGFAPNSSGEVHVAELEEDDINDLISFIGYSPSKNYDNDDQLMHPMYIGDTPEVKALTYPSEPEPDPEPVKPSKEDAAPSKRTPVIAKPVERKTPSARKTSDDPSPSDRRRTQTQRQSSLQIEANPPPTDPTSNEKQKQRDLIDRLSAPKKAPVRLRSNPGDGKGPASPTKQRPRSFELNRSVSVPSSSNGTSRRTISLSTSTTSTFASHTSPSTPNPTRPKVVTPVAGKATGFVRAKISVPTSPKAKLKASPSMKPTAVAKPTLKSSQGKVRQNKGSQTAGKIEVEHSDPALDKSPTCNENDVVDNDTDSDTDSVIISTFPSEEVPIKQDDVFPKGAVEMSSLFLRKTILSTEEEREKSRGYYHLNFDFQDD